jgi:hypothetical protein
MPIVGFFEFTRRPLLKSYLVPLFLIFLGGLFQSLYLKDVEGIVRCGQAMLLVYFGQYLFGLSNKKNHLIFFKSIFFISLLYLILEIIFTRDYFLKQVIPGLFLYRFVGIVGESNFSGLLFSILILMSFYYRKYIWSVLYLLLLATTMSRTYIGLALFGVIGLIFVRIFSNKTRWISLLGILFIILLPLTLILIEQYSDDSFKLYLALKTNGRYPIWITHLSIFRNNIFGVGYFNAHDLFQSYANQGSSIVLHEKFKLVDAPLFQHNMMIHTISEFGFWGYGLLILFLVSFTKKIYHDAEMLFFFMVFLIGCCSLNVFHEFSFYFFLAFMYRQATKEIC